jgi:hypothetical protein
VDDIRRLRESDRAFETAPRRLATPAAPGVQVIVAHIVNEGRFPTSADRVFALRCVKALVRDVEGDLPVWIPYGGTVHAANLGTNLPVEGASVLAFSTTGGLVFTA